MLKSREADVVTALREVLSLIATDARYDESTICMSARQTLNSVEMPRSPAVSPSAVLG